MMLDLDKYKEYMRMYQEIFKNVEMYAVAYATLYTRAMIIARGRDAKTLASEMNHYRFYLQEIYDNSVEVTSFYTSFGDTDEEIIHIPIEVLAMTNEERDAHIDAEIQSILAAERAYADGLAEQRKEQEIAKAKAILAKYNA